MDDRLGRRDDENDVGIDDGGVDPSVVGDRDEVGSGGVVDDDATVKHPCLGRRQEPLELLPAASTCETAGDEERDVLVRDAEALELVENGRERSRTRIDLCAGQWERGRLDDDGDASPRARELVERTAGEWVGEGIANDRRDVDHTRRRRRGAQDHVVGADRDGDDPRAREERDASHGTADDSVGS